MSSFFSQDPATEEVIWQGKEATFEEIKEAIEQAKKAQLKWQKRTFEERAAITWKFATLLDQSFAEIISKEMGKPLWDSQAEVQAMKNKIEISIQAYHERCQPHPRKLPQGQSIIYHKPQGIVAVFGPFNFPGHLPNGHIVPALLAGNAILFKPSEITPKVGEEMGKLWQEAGLPKHILQVVQGGKTVGQMLTQEKEIRGIFFTGSNLVGRAILEASLPFYDRIVALEMGGNNPLIVSKIENLEAAVFQTIQSAFITSGQRCSAARRLIVIENKHSKEFINLLVNTTKELVIGPATLRPEPYMGPVVSTKAAASILKQYNELIELGGKPLLPMKQLGADSAFLSPSIIDVTGVKTKDVEIFGPLLQLIYVQNLEQAIAVANDTVYGLTAGILTSDENEYRQMQDSVKAGIINWNMPTTGASSLAPFGGIGASGNFRPAGYYAADYCSYPVASSEIEKSVLPEKLPAGFPPLKNASFG